MKDRLQLDLLRRVARQRGLIIFTDSDGAGFVIRNFLKSAIENQYLKHAYIPEITGKERRKAAPGKEGILGVEGMRPEVIVECLRRAGATMEGEASSPSAGITKQDLMELGLSGSKNSQLLRQKLLQRLRFPSHMSANAMLQALNLLYTPEQLRDIMTTLLHGEKI